MAFILVETVLRKLYEDLIKIHDAIKQTLPNKIGGVLRKYMITINKK